VNARDRGTPPFRNVSPSCCAQDRACGRSQVLNWPARTLRSSWLSETFPANSTSYSSTDASDAHRLPACDSLSMVPGCSGQLAGCPAPGGEGTLRHRRLHGREASRRETFLRSHSRLMDTTGAGSGLRGHPARIKRNAAIACPRLRCSGARRPIRAQTPCSQRRLALTTQSQHRLAYISPFLELHGPLEAA
jgi:hypothetical protein